ncbi:MAG: homocysteine S-methyltransferase family protein [Candidatus Poribacteria bacterium]|nr:homocysteine S-methyltransferase family protein [Candidatus Poribacteria bacterium]
MAKGILERLADGIVLGDGGYIVELEKRGYVIAGPFTPELAITHPDAIREMHREFLHAGAEVLQVMAFYGSREKLATVGQGARTFEINQAATRIAKEVAGDGLLVAGDLSATWKWDVDSSSARTLVAGMFDEQIEAQAGVDFFIGETFWHFSEALLCLERIKAKTDLPAMITLAFRGSNHTDDGVTASECAKRLRDAGADIVGVNCMRDPERTYPLIEEMRNATDIYLAAQPVAFRCSDEVPWFTGTPAFPDRLEPTQLTRYEMGEFARKAKALGVNYIGSCCGSIACHVREMACALGKYDAPEVWQANPDTPMSETEFNWERRQG